MCSAVSWTSRLEHLQDARVVEPTQGWHFSCEITFAFSQQFRGLLSPSNDLMHDLAKLRATCAFDPSYTHSGTALRDTEKALSASVLLRGLKGAPLPPTLSEARTGLLDSAESLLGEVVDRRVELLGAQHPETLGSQAELRCGSTRHTYNVRHYGCVYN